MDDNGIEVPIVSLDRLSFLVLPDQTSLLLHKARSSHPHLRAFLLSNPNKSAH